MRSLVALIAIGLVANLAQSQQSHPNSSPETLFPVPTDAHLDQGLSKLKSLYEFDYKLVEDKNSAKSELAASALLRKFLKTAAETAPSNDGYYPMVTEAIRLATFTNKPDVAFDTIDRLLTTHEIDASSMRLQVLTHFAEKNTRLNDVKAASRFVIPSVQAAADSQNLQTASTLLAVGQKIAERTLDRTFQREVTQAMEIIEILQQQESEFVSAQKKIEKIQSDPVANLTVAKFLGLRKGKWEEAEVFAAHVEEDNVRSLFVRELANPEGVEEVFLLASDWWDFSETQTGAFKLQAAEVAAVHYASILKKLKGIELKQAETRLAGVVQKHVVSVRMPVENTSVEAETPPPLAIAPFDAPQAKSHQQAFAAYLGVTVESSNSIGMKFALIPPGEFVMGSPTNEPGREGNEASHKVTLTRSFELAVYEVTQEQYQQIMGNNPSRFKGPTNPVEMVSWNDAVEFCSRLSALPGEKAAGYVYRLPTEAEWEYACRAGTTTKFSFGDKDARLDDYAWYDINSNRTSHPIGQKRPNPWGLYDIHGNVWEWCQDWYGDYPDDAVTDPTGARSGTKRVYRGGCWGYLSVGCRSALRTMNTPDYRLSDHGFRVLRSSVK
jgi:formylglycine-generating enzyme required for sulfatase activity